MIISKKTRRQLTGGRPPRSKIRMSFQNNHLGYRDIAEFVLETTEKIDAQICGATPKCSTYLKSDPGTYE